MVLATAAALVEAATAAEMGVREVGVLINNQRHAHALSAPPPLSHEP